MMPSIPKAIIDSWIGFPVEYFSMEGASATNQKDTGAVSKMREFDESYGTIKQLEQVRTLDNHGLCVSIKNDGMLDSIGAATGHRKKT